MTQSRPERVKAIAEQWIGETFVQKNTDYGSSYTLAGDTIRLWFPEGISLDSTLKVTYFQLLTRMLDKLIRASNLVLRALPATVKDEKAYQTIADNGVYSFMAAELLCNGPDLG